VCAFRPHRLLATILLALAASLTGCPGELEDPDRFGEPDSSTGGSTGAGGSSGDAGGDV
jgi:hypothetical protein